MYKAVKDDKKLRNLLVGAIRRVWHRHPARRAAMEKVAVREGRLVFFLCELCGARAKQGISKHYPRAHVDHIEPVVPLDRPLASWDEFIERVFCDPSNLQVLCTTCHTEKTKHERAIKQLSKFSSGP